MVSFVDQWCDDAPCIEVCTSGSTGQPKRMLVEKRRMAASARITCDFLGIKRGDKALLCLSTDYIAGKMMVVRSLERGLRLTSVEPSGHPLASIDDDFDLVAMVPLQVYNTLQEPRERARLLRIRHLLIGGGAIDAELERRLLALMRQSTLTAWSTYGMTESLSHIALRRVGESWYTPFDSVAVSLSADGCLVIDAPEVCAQRLTTNDIAEIDADGRRFRILGRRDNVVCSGGVKMQIEDIEERLRRYVADPFMITKRADAKFGEVVALLTTGDVDQARAAAERALPKYMWPRIYKRVDALPMTPTGKPARAAAAALMRE